MSGIDIVVATYNRCGGIAQLVAALEQQTQEGDRVIVVWQGAEKPALDCSNRSMLVRSNPPNLPAARNTGLRHGENEIVLFVDDDVIPGDELLDAHRACYGDKRVGAVAGFIDDPLFAKDGAEQPSVFNVRTGECIQNFSLEKSCDSLSVMGANMSFRRSVLEELGGFDTGYTRNALWEDVDCAFRVRSLGFVIRFCHQARLTHARAQRGGCRDDRGARYLYHQFANTAYFASKFAPRACLWGWIRFWWFRLEYLSRAADGSRRRHEPVLVAAGLTGALTGLVRYGCAVLHKSRYLRGLDRVDRIVVSMAGRVT